MINNFIKNITSNKIYVIIYLIVVLYLVLITYEHHKNEEIKNAESFIGELKYRNPNIQYSECKKKCNLKYENEEQQKACKAYCKCKRNCNKRLNNKKCLKGCKDLKLNIYRDDEEKVEKIKLKREIKENDKKERRRQKLEKLREDNKQNEVIIEKDNKRAGYLSYLVNNYFTENDKVYLVDFNRNTRHFFKDCKRIFNIK